MPKNKTLKELRPLVPELEHLILQGISKEKAAAWLSLTISDVNKYCRSLASDAALKKLEG